MPLPLPPALRKKLFPASEEETDEGESEGEDPTGEPSESDAPEMKGEKKNPLKAWAASKLGAK